MLFCREWCPGLLFQSTSVSFFCILTTYILGGTKLETGSKEVALSICRRDRLGEPVDRVEDDSAYKLKLV